MAVGGAIEVSGPVVAGGSPEVAAALVARDETDPLRSAMKGQPNELVQMEGLYAKYL